MSESGERSISSVEVTTPARTKRRRPFGVYAIIALLLIDSIATITLLLLLYFDRTILPPGLLLPWSTAAFELGQALLELITIGGLLRLKRWAWYAVMVLTGFDLLVAIWGYFQGQQPYAELFTNTLIVFYLNQRDVQGAFSGEQESTL